MGSVGRVGLFWQSHTSTLNQPQKKVGGLKKTRTALGGQAKSEPQHVSFRLQLLGVFGVPAAENKGKWVRYIHIGCRITQRLPAAKITMEHRWMCGKTGPNWWSSPSTPTKIGLVPVTRALIQEKMEPPTAV